MTNEEAIKRIDNVLSSTYNYDESLGYQLTSDDFEWLEKAKATFEKQIPKKPVWHKYALRCSCCDTQIMRGSHCYGCGQAIDWSEEVEE